MKNFTQKALFVVLTVFVLVGLFYGLSTPVSAAAKSSTSKVPTVTSQDEPIPICFPPTSQCASGSDSGMAQAKR